MFYYNLDGNQQTDNKTGNQLAVGGELLTGIQPDYWSGTEFDPGLAWFVRFANGSHVVVFKNFEQPAWAVRPGDVGAAVIPEPASLLLFGLGALGLGWTRRRTS